MWYVMQVRTGAEEKMKEQCLRTIDPNTLKMCFVPYYEEKKRYRGAWHTKRRVLFPGYVFAVSESIEELYKCLKKVAGMTKLLGTGEEIVPLKEEEVELLQRMGADKKPLEVSTGMIENGMVMITDGPLTGMEGCIKKIDRHKRKAWLEIDMFGRTTTMEAGLEIVKRI